MNYYTSDLHLGHKHLVECGFRKFNTVEECDNKIIDMINTRCTKEDNLYILGDLTMSNDYEKLKQWLGAIHCKKWVIQGNHDSRKILKKLNEDNIICNWFPWKTVDDENCLKDGRPIVISMFHHPVVDYHSSRHADVCFHGHSHGTNQRKFANLYDVGVDCNDFIPKTATEIIYRVAVPEFVGGIN